MPERWVLNRAGITNVYQYGDETLSFAGGRLLLRGVNGSGKSTAMNMLLPFLLDADARRIDAAGEQSGVLRSWMLSGRDEQQPVGYLWIELRRGGQDDPDAEHLAFGCGIRANRSTDRVTTWWFITDRRPGIDVALVEGRVPLSVDALRVALEPGAVFTAEQRGGYRTELRNRLYGGADLDQHIRLLHVVRSPRVGDRIDLDLPRYLEDALPQLSEAALDDAAQPLEDLEEHRRNVEDLARTATTLDALEALYGNYARGELRRRADLALERVAARHAAQQYEGATRRDLDAATAALSAAQAAVAGFEGDERRLAQEIAALRATDAYQRGAELEDLRGHVRSLDKALTAARARVRGRAAALATARAGFDTAAADAHADQVTLTDQLSELGDLAVAAGLAVRPPDAPHVPTRVLGGPVGRGRRGPIAVDDAELPEDGFELDTDPTALADVRAGAKVRLGDVAEVHQALDATDRAETRLRDAEQAHQLADEAATAALATFTDARRSLDATTEAWRAALGPWVDSIDDHRARHGLARSGRGGIDGPDLARARDDIVAALLEGVEGAAEHHRSGRATLRSRLQGEQATFDELAATLADLQARSVPEPPSLPWQQPRATPCVADLVDFAPDLDDAARAGLEAAMEAAGLLGAELDAGGGLHLDDGQLVVGAGPAVARPLGALVTVTVPDDLHGSVDAQALAAVLAAISTDPADLVASVEDRPTVVTTAGEFRTGVLRGRHHKAEAEHVGVTARRAALERRRAEVAAQLDQARAAVERTDAGLAAVEAALDQVIALRRALPPPAAVTAAVARAEHAEDELGAARQRRQARQAALAAADAAHGDAVDAAHRMAATLGLAHDRAGLRRIEVTLGRVTGQCDLLRGTLVSLARAVGRWRQTGLAWAGAVTDHAHSVTELEGVEAEHGPLASRLATLEDAIGLAYSEVVAALAAAERDLDGARAALAGARDAHLDARGARDGAETRHHEASRRREEADTSCVAELPRLRLALAVPGLADAAAHDADAEPEAEADVGYAPPRFPAVAETPQGVAELAAAVRAAIPVPAVEVGADGVRQSLRQRRDALGAGWDAEDRQPDAALPLHVEVVGPLGRMTLADATVRVRVQLHQLTSLLSAKQDQALRNLLQGLIAREVAAKLHAADELVGLMNRRLDSITTSQGIGVSLRWRRRDDLEPDVLAAMELLARPPDLRTAEQDRELAAALAARIADARRVDPDSPYRDLIGAVLDYRSWHRMSLVLHRPGRSDEQLTRRTALSEGEKKMVSYLPLFAAVAASCDALAATDATAPRFVLLDDAFAKVSEDNHAKLFGLLVQLDLDFIATSERLWGTHGTVPELAITEVLRDADLGVIVLEHSRWDGQRRQPAASVHP